MLVGIWEDYMLLTECTVGPAAIVQEYKLLQRPEAAYILVNDRKF